MDRVEIEAKVKDALAINLGHKAQDIKNTDSLVDDLGADSLDLVEMAMQLEDDLEVEIPDEDLEKLATVQAVIDYVLEKKA
jgi:acyl carrier protein